MGMCYGMREGRIFVAGLVMELGHHGSYVSCKGKGVCGSWVTCSPLGVACGI